MLMRNRQPVLLLDFRNVKHMLVALAPMVMGMGMSLGIMVLFGLQLNPANMSITVIAQNAQYDKNDPDSKPAFEFEDRTDALLPRWGRC